MYLMKRQAEMRSQKPVYDGSSYDSNCDLPVKEGRASVMPFE